MTPDQAPPRTPGGLSSAMPRFRPPPSSPPPPLLPSLIPSAPLPLLPVLLSAHPPPLCHCSACAASAPHPETISHRPPHAPPLALAARC